MIARYWPGLQSFGENDLKPAQKERRDQFTCFENWHEKLLQYRYVERY